MGLSDPSREERGTQGDAWASSNGGGGAHTQALAVVAGAAQSGGGAEELIQTMSLDDLLMGTPQRARPPRRVETPRARARAVRAGSV